VETNHYHSTAWRERQQDGLQRITKRVQLAVDM
jgi:hypothetical protein